MSVATRSINSPALQASLEPFAARIARAATITVLESLPSEVIDKTKIGLLDLIGGAFEARGRLKFDENARRVGAGLLIVQWQNGVPLTVYPAKDALAPPAWPKR